MSAPAAGMGGGMTSLVDNARSLFNGLTRNTGTPPLFTSVPDHRVDVPLGSTTLIPGRDYFEVRVVHVHLAYEREWFSRFAPVVLAATEYSYGGETIVAPVVVGPGIVEKLGTAVPVGTVLAGTRVAGPHPLVGPSLACTVVLHKVERERIVEPFLRALDQAASALNLATGLAPYTAVASLVLNGITAITGGDRPLMARRDDFSEVTAGYYALVDADGDVSPDELAVRRGELVLASQHAEKPLQNDYVLYSITSVEPSKVDITRLPLYRVWLSVLEEASKASTAQIWKSAKANMAALVGMLYTSPDLTYAHAEQLHEEWIGKIKTQHDKAIRLGSLSPAEIMLDRARSRSLAVLDM